MLIFYNAVGPGRITTPPVAILLPQALKLIVAKLPTFFF